jgi:hypothetical protein
MMSRIQDLVGKTRIFYERIMELVFWILQKHDLEHSPIKLSKRACYKESLKRDRKWGFYFEPIERTIAKLERDYRTPEFVSPALVQ